MSIVTKLSDFVRRMVAAKRAHHVSRANAHQPSAQGVAVERWQKEMWEELRHLNAQREAYLEEGRLRYHKDEESS